MTILEAIKAGESIRRKSWPKNHSFSPLQEEISIKWKDLIAEDWHPMDSFYPSGSVAWICIKDGTTNNWLYQAGQILFVNNKEILPPEQWKRAPWLDQPEEDIEDIENREDDDE